MLILIHVFDAALKMTSVFVLWQIRSCERKETDKGQSILC